MDEKELAGRTRHNSMDSGATPLKLDAESFSEFSLNIFSPFLDIDDFFV